MDLSFLRCLKKEQGNSIIKQQHTTFSFLFSSLIKKEEQQNKNKNKNKNKNPSSSSVLTHDVTEDDRVCLHFSVGDPSCPECDYHQQQLTTNNNKKKRKRRPQQPQTLMKNKKTRIINNCDEDEEEYDGTICLHLLLGSSSCMPTCCNHHIIVADDHHHHHHDQWEMKKVLEQSDVCLHLSRLLINKDDAQRFIFPFLLGGPEATRTKQGEVRDVDTDTLHSLVFKYWVSAKSHIFTKRWVKDFVNRRNLKKGDQIGLRWDQEKNRFEFSVLGRAAKSD